LSAPALGKGLVDAANRAEARGAPSDAYLALVWAAQVDPDVVRLVYRRIAALRVERRRFPFPEERGLLGAFYESGDPLLQLDLVLFYADLGLWSKAQYFCDRLPPARVDTPVTAWTRELSRARRIVRARSTNDSESSAAAAIPLLGLSSDFEGDPVGWTRKGTAFRSVKDGEDVAPMSGHDGTGYFSSEGAGTVRGGAMGEAESPPFVIAGRALSFVVAGGSSQKLSVDLVVEGKSALHASGRGSRSFFPVVWDLRAWRGKEAILKLSDRDKESFIAIDHIRIWPDLAEASGPGSSGTNDLE
jgi:hypothetical protein